jgi:hypothetical protein
MYKVCTNDIIKQMRRRIKMIQESGDDRIDALFGVMNEVLENDYEN